ncbi:IS66 family transposase [Phascolarctobacterium succinatutens]|uniref:IS66 family transposase n=1 Tax=Phascolarctobacterium succinatutens TaxID=626940 RepID=UPI0034C6D2B1
MEKLILDELFAWTKKLYVTPKSKIGEAVTYLRKQSRYLYNYLLEGKLETSNNRAERSVKPFVISRKNFLFATQQVKLKEAA